MKRKQTIQEKLFCFKGLLDSRLREDDNLEHCLHRTQVNLPSHKIAGARKAIEFMGAELRFLPPYSSDLNPIEKLFSKLKALLKKAAHRTVEALWKEIGSILNSFSSDECKNYFQSSG